MESYITSIATANPSYKISQQEVLDFMIKAHQMNDEEAAHLKILYRATGIQSRYSVIPDYKDNANRTFYPDSTELEPFPSTEMRMRLFQKEAINLCVSAASKALNETNPKTVTHLITVSCTGMYAPGIDIELVDQIGLRSDVERTGVNFMGCYAAFNAMKVADAVCTSHENAVVLIVCVELCSIHFQKEKTDDYLLSNALFGDGAAAMIMSSKPAKGLQLKTESFFSDLYREGDKEMAWKIGDFGFEMKLSAYIPDIIQSGVSALVDGLMQKSGIGSFEYIAIHPGGKKILQVIETELDIDKQANPYAHEILQEYGNMSSPTILFVLKRIWDGLTDEDHGKNILGLAFGPGLTMESAILKIERH